MQLPNAQPVVSTSGQVHQKADLEVVYLLPEQPHSPLLGQSGGSGMYWRKLHFFPLTFKSFNTLKTILVFAKALGLPRPAGHVWRHPHHVRLVRRSSASVQATWQRSKLSESAQCQHVTTESSTEYWLVDHGLVPWLNVLLCCNGNDVFWNRQSAHCI